MAVRARASTAEDLWSLPDDGMRRELIEGEVRMMSPSGAEHGRVTFTLGALLAAQVSQTGAGVGFGAETGFVLGRDPDTVRAPDAAFVTRERADAVGRTVRYWPEAPDFAAEVVSPGDTFAEVEEKALSWLAAGTGLILVVDPARRSATAYRGSDQVQIHRGDEALDLSDVVPGWRIALSDLFR